MNSIDKQQLKQNYENACNAYLKAFCEKHDFSIEDAFWVGDDVGGILNVGDMDFDMATIRIDIDEDASEEELIKWYDYILEASTFKLPTPNFHAWIHGCPRTDSEWFKARHKEYENFKKAISIEAERIRKEDEERKF